MPKVKLDLETDFSPLTGAIAEGQKMVADSGKAVNEFSNDAKAAYLKSWQEANKYNKELQTATKQTQKLGQETKQLGKTTNEVRELRQQIKFYTSEALKAGEGTAAFAENLAKAGKLKDELEDITKAVQSLNGNIGENFARAAGESISVVSSGYEGLIALQNLLGAETENYEKALLKLQSIRSIATIAKEFAGIKDVLTEIRLGFKPVTDLFARGGQSLVDFFHKGTEGAKDLEKANVGVFNSIKNGLKGIVTVGSFGGVLAVITTIITALVVLRDKIEPIAELFEGVGKILEKVGQFFGLVASESEKATKKLIENTEEQLKAIKNLYDFEIKLAEARNQRTEDLEKQKTQALKKALNERLTAFLNLELAGKKLDDEQLKQQKEFTEQYEDLLGEQIIGEANLLKEREKLRKDNFNKIIESNLQAVTDEQTKEKALVRFHYYQQEQEIVEQIKRLYDTEEEQRAIGENVIAGLHQQRDKELSDIDEKFRKKREEELKKQQEKLKQLEKDFLDALLDIRRKAEQSQINQLKDEARIEAEKQFALRELEVLRQNLIAKGQAEENYLAEIQKRKAHTFHLDLFQQEQFNILERSIFNEATQKLIALQVERENALAKARSDNARKKEVTLSSQEETEILSVKATRRPVGVPEEQFEKQKQIAILNIQKKYAEKQLELKKATIAAEREESIKAYNGELEIVGNGEDAVTQKKREEVVERVNVAEAGYIAQQDEADEAYEAELTSIDNQLTALNNKNRFDLARLLGISDNDLANLQNAIGQIQQTFDTILDGLISEQDQQIEISQKKQNQYQQDIESLENKITKEQQLDQTGKANNKTRLLKEIEDKKALEAKQKEIELKALEEKKRIQKQKLLIDTIAQVSNLAVAASEILANTANSGPVGVAIGLATIAVMLIGFTAAKVQALKTIQAQTDDQAKNLSKGEIDIKGPGTETSDSIRANLSRGESVMTARETKDNKTLFRGIRLRKKSLIQEGIENLLENTGVTLSRDLPKNLSDKKEQIKQAELKVIVNNDYSQLKYAQDETNKRLETLISEAKTRVYHDQNGNLVKQSGTHKTIIKKG